MQPHQPNIKSPATSAFQLELPVLSANTVVRCLCGEKNHMETVLGRSHHQLCAWLMRHAAVSEAVLQGCELALANIWRLLIDRDRLELMAKLALKPDRQAEILSRYESGRKRDGAPDASAAFISEVLTAASVGVSELFESSDGIIALSRIMAQASDSSEQLTFVTLRELGQRYNIPQLAAAIRAGQQQAVLSFTDLKTAIHDLPPITLKTHDRADFALEQAKGGLGRFRVQERTLVEALLSASRDAQFGAASQSTGEAFGAYVLKLEERRPSLGHGVLSSLEEVYL